MRTHLAALVLAILLPSLALGAVTAWHMAANYRNAFEERLSDTAQALALAVSREVQAHVAALTALAASPYLQADDLAGFYPHARGAAEAIGTPIVVIGADLRQRLHTQRPFGSPLPTTSAAEAIRTALATQQAAVSNLLIGAVLGVPVVTVVVPVLPGGRSNTVLTAPLVPDRISRLLASQGLNGGAFATVMDGRDVIVARSREAAEYVGRPAPTWLAEKIVGQEAGVLRGRTLAGEAVILAFRRLASLPGWTVVVGEPLAAYEASWRRPLLALAAGGAAALLIALGAITWLGRRILRPVRALTRQAEAVAAGGGDEHVPDGEPAGVAEFDRLQMAVRRADAALRAKAAVVAEGEARRALLAREVDHRAKNVLAVVQAVLRLTRADEPRAYAAAVSARVASLARAHSLLAECGWSGADLRAIVLREVTPYAPVQHAEAALILDGPPVTLVPVMVQPLGMVLHELATNAAQHGALSTPSGRVSIRWDVGEHRLLTLRWSEIGGPPVGDAPARRGFGMKLIETAVRGQLSGTVGFRWEPIGLTVEIAVPLARAAADGGTATAEHAAAVVGTVERRASPETSMR